MAPPRAIRQALVTLAAALALAAAPPAHAQRSGRSAASGPPLLLDRSFPVEVSIESHAGLLHWLDSLTAMHGPGLTAGKSIEAHRAEFNKRLGRPSPEERRFLQRYVDARQTAVSRNHHGNPDALTRAFLQAGSMAEALDALPALLDAETAAELRETFAYFAPRYERIWRGGQVARSFVQRVNKDPRRPEVSAFMVDVARFYGVPPVADPAPRLHLVPVIDGYGTHAQAVGRHLLVEVRPWEGLSEQLAPIVHENAHFLFERIEPERLEALRRAAGDSGGANGAIAWIVLREALPTAIAQGVAGKRFAAQGWSKQEPWYHLEEVDAYAKALFELVETALAGDGKLDEAFVRRAVALYTPPRDD